MTDRVPSRRVRRALIASVPIAAIVFVFFAGSELVTWVRFEREKVSQEFGGESVVGWRLTPRFEKTAMEAKRILLFSERTGYLVYDLRADDETSIRSTRWTPEGKVIEQTILEIGVRSEVKSDPPWWWGASDQSSPSSPWGAANPEAD